MMQDKRKVLIVDDDEGTREFVEAIMANEGWATVEGRNGREAIELAEQEQPDLIILDVMMPEMDGFEAFQQLRSQFLTKDIPVVMLTALNDLQPGPDHNEETMEQQLGVNRPEGFVDKPVDAVFLLNTILGVVG